MKRSLSMIQSTALIPLTQGLSATVDVEDVELLNQFKWCAHRIGKSIYAATTVGKNTVHMHRVLCPEAEIVDHLDGNGLNNTRSNLRFADEQKNSRNRKKRLDLSSDAKGVSQFRGKWMARITVSGKTEYLGIFSSQQAASAAYNAAASKEFGEFARLNEV